MSRPSEADVPPAAAASGEGEAFRHDVLRGLGDRPKWLPSKYFYDERGSRLFDAICEQPEYYLTRTELAIMRAHAAEMAALLGPACLLVEYGSGSSVKTRLLLDHLEAPAAYVPLDISREHLYGAAARIAEAYPGLHVAPLCADFTQPYALPEAPPARRRAVYFPGSTIGNFTPAEAREFLARIALVCSADGAAEEPGCALVGVDMAKPREVVEPAYNDAAGVTAEFNLNLLGRINRELGGDFSLDCFRHRAFYDEEDGRIEMHLESLRAQVATVAGTRFRFAEGETVRTEYSYKYTPERFDRLAADAGLRLRHSWVDDRGWFAVHYLEPV